jgi:ABC-type nitrate/sulfonate/bicarbonate transport system permease component
VSTIAKPSPVLARPQRPRAAFRGEREALLYGLCGVLVVTALAELAPRIGLVSPNVFPPPSETLEELFRQVQTSGFWSAVGATMEGWAIGLSLAAVLGIGFGILLGSSRLLRTATRPSIDFLRSIPGIAILPLIMIVEPNDMRMKVILIVFGAVWFFLLQTIYGVIGVDTVARDTVRSFGFGRLDRVRFLILPSALPYVATGLRLAAAVALTIGVTVELLTGIPGLGRSILATEASGQLTVMYALIFATGIIGVAIHLAIAQLERRTMRWHPSHRADLEKSVL